MEAGAEGRVEVERTLSLVQMQELEQKVDHQRNCDDGHTAKNAERRSWKSPTPIQILFSPNLLMASSVISRSVRKRYGLRI